jgi:hypothetical protein
MNEIKEAISKAPKSRVTRVPVGTRNVLTVAGKDPAYEYRIINDAGDRVQEFLDAGYELVQDNSVKVGDKRVNGASSEGTVSHISVGQGQKAFVVRIKKEWYEEDQATKQLRVNELEASTKAKALNGTYGKLDVVRGSE